MSFIELCVVPTVTINTPHIRLLMRYMTDADKTQILNDWMNSDACYMEYIIPQYCLFKGFNVADFIRDRQLDDIKPEVSQLPYRMGMSIIAERNDPTFRIHSVITTEHHASVIVCNADIPLPAYIIILIHELAINNYMHMEPESRYQTLMIFDLYLFRPSIDTGQVAFHKDSGQNRHGYTPRIPEIGSENIDFISLLYLANTQTVFRGATFIVDEIDTVGDVNQLSLAVTSGTTVVFRDYAFYHGTPQSVIPTDKASTLLFTQNQVLTHKSPAMSELIKGTPIESEINNPPPRQFLRTHFVTCPVQQYTQVGDPLFITHHLDDIRHNAYMHVEVTGPGQLNDVLDPTQSPLNFFSIGGTKIQKSNRKIGNKTRKIGGRVPNRVRKSVRNSVSQSVPNRVRNSVRNSVSQSVPNRVSHSVSHSVPNHIRNIDVCCKTSDYYAFDKKKSRLALNLEGLNV